MSAVRIAGLVLIVIGLIGLIWGGISWTDERTVVDLGPIEARTQERETIPISPIVGGVALVAGIVLMVVPSRRKV
jgi:UDP-N-acetylmuramyl pentapeptide phosphotransferase/UDP-N-acetylglucosamine-1-phosphate transferase